LDSTTKITNDKQFTRAKQTQIFTHTKITHAHLVITVCYVTYTFLILVLFHKSKSKIIKVPFKYGKLWTT